MCCSSVEDQDSSGEGGLNSNWWVLGSQGKDPFSTPGDATLQTLSQSALSPLGTQSIQKQLQVESESESATNNSEQNQHESQETSNERRNGSNEQQPDLETSPGRSQVAEEREKQEHGENESVSNDEGIPFRRLHFSS